MAGDRLDQIAAKMKVLVAPEGQDRFLQVVRELRQAFNDTQRAADQTRRTMGDVEKSTTRWQKALGAAAQSLSLLNRLGGNLRNIGFDLQQSGQSLSQELEQGAQAYARAMGKTTATARQYADYMRRIEVAQIRAGEVAARQLAPSMESAARSAELWATFAERNPKLIGTMAQIGQAVSGGGKILIETGAQVQAIGAIFELPVKIKRAWQEVAEGIEPLRETFRDIIKVRQSGKDAVVAAVTKSAADKNAAAAGIMAEAAATNMAAAKTDEVTALRRSLGQRMPLPGGGGGLDVDAFRKQLMQPRIGGVPLTGGALGTGFGGSGISGASLLAAAGPATILGGLALGGLASSALARPEVNNSPAVKALDSMVNGITRPIAQFGLSISKTLGPLTAFVPILGNIAQFGKDTGGEGLGFQFTDPLKALGQVASIAGKGLGDLVGGQQVGNEWFAAIGRMTGALDEATASALDLANAQASGKTALDISPARAEAIQAYIEFANQNAEAEKQFLDQRSKAIADFNKDVAEADKEFYKAREKEATDFAKGQQEAAREFGLGQYKARQEFAKDQQKELQGLLKGFARDDMLLARQRAKEDAAFAKAEAEAETQYYDQRLQAVEDFGKEQADREREHQKEMRRAREDHEDSLRDLAEGRDALGIVRAVRQYEKERRRREEDYLDGLNEAKEQQAVRLKDMEANFRQEREKRLADFQERRKEDDDERKFQRDLQRKDFQEQQRERQREFSERQQAERKDFQERQAKERQDFRTRQTEQDQQYREQKSKRAVQHAETLAQMEDQYKKEKERRARDFRERINQMDENLLGEARSRARYQDLMAGDFENWLKAMRGAITSGNVNYNAPTYTRDPNTGQLTVRTQNGTTTVNPRQAASRQLGGYANLGLYQLGEKGTEYILNADTTRAMEAAFGRPLRQDAMLAGIANGPGGVVARGGNSIRLGDITVGGGSAEETARQASDMVYGQLLEALKRLEA